METTSDSLTTFQPILTQTNPTKIPLPVPPQFSPSRIGSGTSLVTDLETGIEAESSSKYIGVCPQPTGRWAAKIYCRKTKKSVWLGSFKEHHQAVRAYDIAVHRFRGPNVMTLSEDELDFINSKSEDELADILRKHSYYSQLHSFIKRKHATNFNVVGGRDLLFEKVLTATDVETTYSLLSIPKRHAENHLPVPLALSGRNGKCLVLEFEDGDGKVWRFRYLFRKCGWIRKNRYTFSKDWCWFVKDKNLKAGDTVLFYRSSTFENRFYIDFKRTSTGQTTNGSLSGSGSVQQVVPVQKIRLFGVDINM